MLLHTHQVQCLWCPCSSPGGRPLSLPPSPQTLSAGKHQQLRFTHSLPLFYCIFLLCTTLARMLVDFSKIRWSNLSYSRYHWWGEHKHMWIRRYHLLWVFVLFVIYVFSNRGNLSYYIGGKQKNSSLSKGNKSSLSQYWTSTTQPSESETHLLLYSGWALGSKSQSPPPCADLVVTGRFGTLWPGLKHFCQSEGKQHYRELFWKLRSWTST